MRLNLSPELLIANYIKSGTKGRIISVRLRRILTLIIIPTWLGFLVWSGAATYQGISAFNDVKRIENSIRETNKFYGDTNHTQLLELELYRAEDAKDLVYYLPVFLIVSLLIPWLILRIIFWIIDAESNKEAT
jgi:hypothetical protein